MKPFFARSTTALSIAAVAAIFSSAASAQNVSNVIFINGLALDGALLDKSVGSNFDRRVGFFSDIYYEARTNS